MDRCPRCRVETPVGGEPQYFCSRQPGCAREVAQAPQDAFQEEVLRLLTRIAETQAEALQLVLDERHERRAAGRPRMGRPA
jgi:hypothetical protein